MSSVREVALIGEGAADAENVVETLAPPKYSLRWYHWALLISISILGPFSTDSYIPNMPEMIGDLQTTDVDAGLTLQLNWITKAIFNIILGRLSDIYGRRPVIIYSFLFYMAGTLGASFAPTIGWLIASRVVQAVGEANDSITSAVARDSIEDPNERMRMLTLLASIRPFAIIAAPSVGGVLGGLFGWRNVFRMLFIWGTLNMFLTAKLIPETLERGTSSSVQLSLRMQFRRLFCDRLSCGLIFCFALLIACPMTMLCGIPFVLEDSFKLNDEFASLLIGSIPLMMMLASFLLGKFASHLVPLTLMRSGMVLQLLTVFAAFFVVSFASGSWLATMGVFYWMVFSQSVVIPPLNTIFFQPLKDMAGLAGGVQTCVQTFLGAAFGAVGTEATEANGSVGLLVTLGSMVALNQVWFWSLIGICPPRGAQDCAEDAEETSSNPQSGASQDEPTLPGGKRDPELGANVNPASPMAGA